MFPLGRSFSQRRTYSRDSAEMFVTSASVKPWRANASGAVGMGYVGQFTSPTCPTPAPSVPRFQRSAPQLLGRRGRVSRLRDLSHGVRPLPASLGPRARRLSWQVVVPQVVVGSLEVPFPLARSCVESDYAVPEEVLTRPVGAVEVEGWRH